MVKAGAPSCGKSLGKLGLVSLAKGRLWGAYGVCIKMTGRLFTLAHGRRTRDKLAQIETTEVQMEYKEKLFHS